jgi:hypothetical protein
MESLQAELQHAIDAAVERHGQGEAEVPEEIRQFQQKESSD